MYANSARVMPFGSRASGSILVMSSGSDSRHWDFKRRIYLRILSSSLIGIGLGFLKKGEVFFKKSAGYKKPICLFKGRG